MSATITAETRHKRLAHDERRVLIIDTTLACLARHGAEGTTLRSVCREMGVAPSLITHFFAGWHDLLVAAYQTVIDRFLAHVTPVLAMEFPTERARMDEMIRRYLCTDWVGEHTIGAHIALWQLSRGVMELRPLFSSGLADRARVLRQALGQLAAEAQVAVDVDEVTTCFSLMLDGVWLELSLNPGNISAERARQMCWFWIDAALHTR